MGSGAVLVLMIASSYGVSQRMALVVSHDGTTKIIENDNNQYEMF